MPNNTWKSVIRPILTLTCHGYIGLRVGPIDNWSSDMLMASENLVEKIFDLLGISVESLCTIQFFLVRIFPTSHHVKQYKLIENQEIVERVQLHVSTVTEQLKMKIGRRSRVCGRDVVSGCA